MPTDFDITISESGEMVNEHLENNIKCFNSNPIELFYQCSSAFGRKSTLIIHKRIHKGLTSS